MYIDCGILSTEVTALITHAQETTRKYAFPWHAAIFREQENEPGQYMYICGGSLIERKIILTAGHCVHEAARSPHRSSQYKVVLAPVSTDYEENVADKLSKVFDVSFDP
jgi:V8-like Glu-specific endopeptidase